MAAKNSKLVRTDLTELERSIVRKLCTARFPPGTASKRFARDFESGYIKQLSPRGRQFLAFVVHRFRRQYSLTGEEQAWVDQWLKYDEPFAYDAMPDPANNVLAHAAIEPQPLLPFPAPPDPS